LSLKEISLEPSFRSNVESSIAAGLGVKEEQVAVTNIEIDGRRLEAEHRRLNAALKVDYEIYVGGDAERSRIKSQQSAGAANDDFGRTFSKSLQAKEKASGRSMIIDSVKVEPGDVVERTVSIEEAKVAAKEKAAKEKAAEEKAAEEKDDTTTTKKAPTMKSATESPTESPGAPAKAMQDDDTAGFAAAITPSFCVVALLLQLGY
jgi:hypothetical protein